MQEFETMPNFNQQLVLEQLRQHHRETIATFRALDSKAQSALEFNSIIITVIIGFQLAASKTPNLVITGFSLVCYIASVLSAFKVLFPKDLQHEPIKALWSEIYSSLKQDKYELLYSVLSGYEDAIQANRKINNDKSWYVQLTFILLFLTVIAGFLSIFIPS